MALTNYQQPYAFSPAFNQQIFESVSNQVAMTDFMYRVIANDLLSGGSQTYNIKKRPNGNFEMVWDAKVFTDQYIKHYVPNNSYGWKKCTDSFRKIRVNVGEYYSAAYHAGADYDYYIWNAVARPLDWVYYTQSDYVYNNATNQIALNETSSPYAYGVHKVYTDKSLYLYILGGSAANTIPGITITTYDSGGTLLGTSTIANPYSGSATYSDWMVCIDIGLKGLTNIPSGLVTGTYPIITPSVYQINISDSSFGGSLLKTLTVDCETRHTIYTLQYLANNGYFETLNCTKVSEQTETSEKTYYRTNPNTLSSNHYGYARDSQWEKVLSSTGTDRYILNTNWMSETDIAIHRQLITSPVVYMDMGSTIGLIPVKVNNADYLVNKNWNNKNYGLTIDVTPTYRNVYQHG